MEYYSNLIYLKGISIIKNPIYYNSIFVIERIIDYVVDWYIIEPIFILKH